LIDARASNTVVRCVAAVQVVVAIPPVHDVPTLTTCEMVISAIAVKLVGESLARNDVRACTGEHIVIAAPTRDHVIAGASFEEVLPTLSEQMIRPAPSSEALPEDER
jgi:hypothetical protein